MDALPLLLTIALAHFLIVITPGPNFLVVLKVSVSTSRKHGLIIVRGKRTQRTLHTKDPM